MVFFNNILYAVGIFREMGGYARHNVAAIDTITGYTTAWNAEINTSRSAYDAVICGASTNLLCVAGNFYVAVRAPTRSFAAMSLSGTAAAPQIIHPLFNDPNIRAHPDQTTPVGQQTPALAFRVADADTPASALTLTGSSTIKTLVPDANITFAGSDGNRTVTVRPAAGQSGITDIRITVSDGVLSTYSEFSLIVQGASTNTPPTISTVANKTTDDDRPGRNDSPGCNLAEFQWRRD